MLLGGALCLLAVAGMAPPDFSGTWKLNNDKSTPDGPADRTYICVVKQDRSGVTVSTTATPTPPQPPLDGRFDFKDKPVATKHGDQYHSQRVFFEGATLVFEFVDRRGPEKKPTEVKAIRESWVLSADGKLLTKFRRTAANGKVIDQKYVFDRQ